MATLGEIAKQVHGELVGDPSLSFAGIAPIDSASAEQITFYLDPKLESFLGTTKAGAIILRKEVQGGPSNRIEVEDPYWSFAKATELFTDKNLPPEGIHRTAMVDSTAKIGRGVRIGAYCVIGKNVVIGDHTALGVFCVVEEEADLGHHTFLHPRVTVGKKCRIGDRVLVHSGAVIGSEGFGFAEKNQVYTKIHQLGWVEIGDDVEIGSNCCIDRGTLGATILKKGVKLDNLIHIAHNVEIGENTAIAAQVGVSGSTKIGRHVKIGGQAGFAGHLQVGNHSFIGAQAGISKSLPDSSKVTGTPAREIGLVRRAEAALYALPEFMKKFRRQETGRDSG